MAFDLFKPNHTLYHDIIHIVFSTKFVGVCLM